MNDCTKETVLWEAGSETKTVNDADVKEAMRHKAFQDVNVKLKNNS